MSSKLIIGGDKLRARLVSLAAEDTDVKVVLEKATVASRTRPNSAGRKGIHDTPEVSIQVETVSLEDTVEYLSLFESRMVLLISLYWLMDRLEDSIRIREEVLLFLQSLLNSSTHICLIKDTPVNAQIMSILNGSGRIVRSDGSIALLDSKAPGLTVEEENSIRKCPLLLISSMCTLVANTSVLLEFADVAAAVSCDAVKAETKGMLSSIESEHSAVSQVKSNLNSMLKGSKLVNKAKRKESDPKAFSNLVSAHGCARQVISEALKVLVIDLNTKAYVPSVQTKMSLISIISALNTLGSSCMARIIALSTPLYSGTTVDSEILDSATFLGSSMQNIAKNTCNSLSTLTEDFDAISLLPILFSALEASKALENILRLELTVSHQILESQQKEILISFESSDTSGKRRPPKFIPGSGTAFVIDNREKLLRPLFLLKDDLTVLLTPCNENRKPKLPKGTRDFGAAQMAVRETVFSLIKSVFLKHGGVGLDTPVFELRETLMGKYGEDSKLIYDLADQGGELLSLRYDLTVPFARYLAMNNVGNIKRYHIGKVYRRDNVAIEKGRFREFYQCDFDIAGHYDPMIPDAEVLKVLCEILSALGLEFCIKLNHRSFLDAFLEISGVASEKFRTICSAIDKLDKMSWNEVKEEMVEKGLDATTAEKVGEFVRFKGEPFQLMHQLRALNSIKDHKLASDTLDQMELLFGYLESMNVLQFISFDLSLARGLNYYTGVIYEAVLTDPETKVGSIAAGGRYDELVGIFCSKTIPSVGVSIGIERIFDIVLRREQAKANVKETATQVLVASIGPDLTRERFELCNELWEAGIPAEIVLAAKPSSKKQLNHALKNKIPFLLFIGEDELQGGNVNVKQIESETQQVVPRSQLIEYIRLRL